MYFWMYFPVTRTSNSRLKDHSETDLPKQYTGIKENFFQRKGQVRYYRVRIALNFSRSSAFRFLKKFFQPKIYFLGLLSHKGVRRCAS